ncbi:MAG: MFS transporter [Nitratireductor sp.]
MTRTILPILALFTSTFFLLVGGGVQWIVLPIRAQMEAFSTDAIGIIGLGWATGFTAGCLIVPRIVRRVGHVRAFSSLLALAAIAILVTAMAINPIAWFAMRVVSGLCFSGSYMIIESWLNERVGNESRGALFAIYAMITMAGVMTGQYVILFVDPGSQTAFMVAAILFALAILPTALSTAQSPQALTEVRLNIVDLYRNSPVALIGIFLAGSIAGAWQSFAPASAPCRDCPMSMSPM